MKLVASVPEGWNVFLDAPDRISHDPQLFVDLELAARSLTPVRFQAVGDEPADTLQLTSRTQGHTDTGWPYERLEVAVLGPAGIAEARIVIVLDLGDHIGVARVRAFQPDLVREQCSAIESIIASLRPAPYEPVAINALWSTDVTQWPRDLNEWSDTTQIEVHDGRVVRPRDRDELATALALRTLNRPKLRARRAFTETGFAIDMRGLDRIIRDRPEDETITIEAGCTWRQLAAHLRPQGRRPVSLVADVDRSIGSTLASGGAGDRSHLDGSCIEHVTELEVMRANGRARLHRGDDELGLVLGAGGSTGAIIEATLRTMRGPVVVTARTLTWPTVPAFLRDARTIARERLADVLRASIIPGPASIGVAALVASTQSSDVDLRALSPVTASLPALVDLTTSEIAPEAIHYELAVPVDGSDESIPQLVRGLAASELLQKLRVRPSIGLVATDRLPLSPFALGGTHAVVLAITVERPQPPQRAVLEAAAGYVLERGGRVGMEGVTLTTPTFLERQFGSAAAALREAIDRSLNV